MLVARVQEEAGQRVEGQAPKENEREQALLPSAELDHSSLPRAGILRLLELRLARAAAVFRQVIVL